MGKAYGGSQPYMTAQPSKRAVPDALVPTNQTPEQGPLLYLCSRQTDGSELATQYRYIDDRDAYQYEVYARHTLERVGFRAKANFRWWHKVHDPSGGQGRGQSAVSKLQGGFCICAIGLVYTLYLLRLHVAGRVRRRRNGVSSSA